MEQIQLTTEKFSFTQVLDKIIKEAGFELWGATPVETFEEFIVNITEFYFKNKYYATMEWLKKTADVRLDPKKRFPQANTIIVVAKNYYQPKPQMDGENRNGLISTYALGRDYHYILSEKLQILCEFLLQNGAVFAKYYVDTGPVFEKYWAVKANLGWLGKNALLINRKLGSFLFLGVILTDLYITYKPQTINFNYCGSCNRCITACPTSAIVSNGVIDANKCIAYLTVEHRGIIKKQLRELMGRWVFGCDICQDVCPWNIKFAKPAVLSDCSENTRTGISKNAINKDELLKILQMSEQEFNLKFKESPIKRTKWEGLIRNTMIVVVNLKIIEAIPLLRKFLHTHNTILKATAIWALLKLNAITKDELEKLLKEEKSQEVLEEIKWALQQINQQ